MAKETHTLTLKHLNLHYEITLPGLVFFLWAFALNVFA